MSFPTVTARLGVSLVIVLSIMLASARIQAAPPLQVSAADPTSAAQATVDLDVTISGSGFDSSAAVDFFVTGTTNPGGITVNKVTVLGSKKLIAKINVAEAAQISSFDIQVRQSGGRKGKGTSLFRVTAKVTDPCEASGLDFPAFTFWRWSGQDKQIYVADATGQCVRPVLTLTGDLGSSANTQKLSYPVAGTTNVGRLTWTVNDNVEVVNLIYVFTFQVTGTSISSGTLEVIYDSYPVGIWGIDLSDDGTTVYFSLDTQEPSDSPRVMAIDADGSNLREVFVGPPDGSDFNKIAVNEDGALFVTKTSGASGLRQLLRIAGSCNNPTCAILLAETTAGSSAPAFPAASLVDDRLGYLLGLPGFTNCWQVQVIPDTGGPILNSAQPRYGRDPTWYGEKVLVDGHKAPTRKGVCESTGMITQIDPDTSAETPLVRGFDPDGR